MLKWMLQWIHACYEINLNNLSPQQRDAINFPEYNITIISSIKIQLFFDCIHDIFMTHYIGSHCSLILVIVYHIKIELFIDRIHDMISF